MILGTGFQQRGIEVDSDFGSLFSMKRAKGIKKIKMAYSKIPMRSEIPAEHTWNASSVFSSNEVWEGEFERLSETLSELGKFHGHLGENPDLLIEALGTFEDIKQRISRVLVYAGMSHKVDTTNQTATGMFSKAQGLYGKTLAAAAFIDPEVLAMGEEKLDQWIKERPGLAKYAHYFGNLFRKQAHVRSAEVEEILGMLADPFSGAQTTASMLTNADFSFAHAIASDGDRVPVTQGTLDNILASPDREARRTAWEHYTDTYLAFKNTLAGNLSTSIGQNVFNMRTRGHDSTLAASLFENNIPVEVFHNLINTFRSHLPTWHRYWALRRKALNMNTLHPYDIWAPLTGDQPPIPYGQAVDWICQALAPLGEEYVSVMRKGCLEDRWVDIYPNQGKSAGAFSWGAPGTHPFILMNYTDDIGSLSTLAHELGHAMHSYLTWQNQPPIYSEYALFVAEVASNFHQAMVRAYLLDNSSDTSLQIRLIEEAMDNFHRYFFIMPTLARFELETHKRVEQGKGLTADDMIELMADLFSEGYGDGIHVDRERVGITWATFGHLYIDYYVYQYATGISGAHALSKRILSREKGAVDDYLSFLKAGGSVYPIDGLKMAGVDLSTPQAVEETFSVLSGLLDRLEELISK
jgi:oligoendopeptidase F